MAEGGIVNWLTTPRESGWQELLRTVLLTSPLGVSVGREAVKRGTPAMALGQMLQPMIQRGENERLWGAFKAGGLLPEGVDPTPLMQAGVDPRTGLLLMRQQDQSVPLSTIPGYVEQFPEAEREAMGRLRVSRSSLDDLTRQLAEGRLRATALRQELEAEGVTPEQIRVGPMITTADATLYRQRVKDLREQREKEATRQRLAEQYQAITGQPVPGGIADPSVIGQMLSAYNAQRSQERSQAAADARLQQSQGAMNERMLRLEQMRLGREEREAIRGAEGEVLRDIERTLTELNKDIAELKANPVLTSSTTMGAQLKARLAEMEGQARDLQERKTRLQKHRLKESPEAGKAPVDIFSRY